MLEAVPLSVASVNVTRVQHGTLGGGDASRSDSIADR